MLLIKSELCEAICDFILINYIGVTTELHMFHIIQ